MTTALEIINRAYVIVGMKSVGETLSGDLVSDALYALNDLLDSWKTEDLLVYVKKGDEREPVLRFELDRDYALLPGYSRALSYGLSEELAVGVRELPASTLALAMQARRTVKRTLLRRAVLHMPPELKPQGAFDIVEGQ